MGLFAKQPSAYLGIDIGAHGMKLVELHNTKGRPQLWTYGILDESLDIHVDVIKEKTPDDLLEEAGKHIKKKKAGDAIANDVYDLLSDETKQHIDRYAKLLKILLEKARVTTHRVTASLPVSHIFHAVLTLPRVEQKELPGIIMAEVKKMLPRPIEEMQVAHQIIPDTEEKNQKYNKVLVTAAPKALVAFYTAIFTKAGLQLQELETEAFSLERTLIGRDKTTAMIVDIGAERTNFFIIDQGLPVTHRSIQLGGNAFNQILSVALGIEDSLVEQMKQDLSQLPSGALSRDIFADPIDAIVKEIAYSFDLFLHQIGNEGKRPEKIILTGGSSVIPVIQDVLREAFTVKVFVGDPWARIVYQQSLRPLLDTIGPRMGVSIGLALRSIVQL